MNKATFPVTNPFPNSVKLLPERKMAASLTPDNAEIKIPIKNKTFFNLLNGLKK